MNAAVRESMASSENPNWQTPEFFLERVRHVGPIALDPCTTPENNTRAKYFCVPTEMYTGQPGEYPDGLAWDWNAFGGLIFCNPPYGRHIPPWIKKIHEHSFFGEIVALLPARVDTNWFQRSIAPPHSRCVLFWRSRIKFVGAKDPAFFPSAVSYSGPNVQRFKEAFADCGTFWEAA
jgi:hypothetical protein